MQEQTPEQYEPNTAAEFKAEDPADPTYEKIERSKSAESWMKSPEPTGPPFSENEMRLARFLIKRFADRLDPNAVTPIDTAMELLNEYADLTERASELKPYVSARVVYHPMHPTQTHPGTHNTVEDSTAFHNGVSERDVLAAVITRVLSTDDALVNLYVYSDGGGILYKPRVTRGSGFGQWDWPAQS